MATPIGYWPGLFLTIHYPDRDKSSPLVVMHHELLDSFRSGAFKQHAGADSIVSHFITTTIQPYAVNLTPCGDRTPISLRPAFGPDAPLAGVLPTTYSASTSQLVVDVVDNSNPANHGRWVIGEIPPSTELIPDKARTVSSVQLGGVHLQGQALELPDMQPSPIAGLPGTFQGSAFTPIAYASDFHYETGLPAIECLLRATSQSAKPDEWRMIVDRLLPESIVQTPRMRELSTAPTITDVARTYNLQVGRNSAIDNSFLLYCCPVYRHQQKLILVGGRVVRQKPHDKVVTIHDVDLVYNQVSHTYEAQWKRNEAQSVSGVMLFPVNVCADTRRQPVRGDEENTAEFRVAYRYAIDSSSGHSARPENLPEAALVDPFNREPDGNPTLIRIPPPFFNSVPHEGEPFGDWYDVYLPGYSPSNAVQRIRQYAPGVHDLVHNHCGGVLFRVRLPRAIALHHRTVHLDEVKFVVSTRSVMETHPFTLILPVRAGTNRNWNSQMRAASLAARRPSSAATAPPLQ
jgi:hypothetical protein